MDADLRCGLGDFGLANPLGHILSIQKHAIAALGGLQADSGFGGQPGQRCFIAGGDLVFQSLESEGAVHGSRSRD